MTDTCVKANFSKRRWKNGGNTNTEARNVGKPDMLIDEQMNDKSKMRQMRHSNDERSDNISSLSTKQAATFVRKPVDPKTAKYFLEIANRFKSGDMDPEEISTICTNALEATEEKEFELVTDAIISHTLQNLVLSCNLEQLCSFLYNCRDVFSLIAVDKAGSHVAEAALRSLARHALNESCRSSVEVTLVHLCKAISVDSVNVMRSSYGSHVLRTLLCLCKGVPVDHLQDFHITKTSAALSRRFNPEPDHSIAYNPEHGFPEIFTNLVRDIMEQIKDDIDTLRVDKCGSFVLQAALKLTVGDNKALAYVISVLLGYGKKDMAEEKLIHSGRMQEFMVLLNNTASSHLLELIIEAAPEEIYDDLLTEIFRGILFDTSCQQCGNFVVQALISSVKSPDHLKLIWEELGSKIVELLELRKFGVVASILAACQRLQSFRLECCEAVRTAITPDSEASASVVAHMLFIDNFFDRKASWTWPLGEKMNVMGCVMLQIILKFPHQYARSYASSLMSMNSDQILQTAKDPGGSRVLEAFISSSVSLKRKYTLMSKLRNNYGDLALKPWSSFLVEKCFSASNDSHKESIVAELVHRRAELSKTRHGLHLLKKLDVEGYVRQPARWKTSHLSKETASKDHDVFGFGCKVQEHQDVHTSSSSRKRKQKETDAAPKKSTSLDAGAKTWVRKSSGGKKLKSSNGAAKEDSAKFISNNSPVPFLSNSGRRKPSVGKPADMASRRSNGKGRKRC